MEKYDDTVIHLRRLEACNLYLSILTRAEACNTMSNSQLIFEMMNGDVDLKTLENVYIEDKTFDPKITFGEFLEMVKDSYQYLDMPTTCQSQQVKDVKKRTLVFTEYLNTIGEKQEVIDLEVMDFLYRKLVQGIFKKEKII